MLPRLFHHSDSPSADEEDSSNSRNHEKDEEDEGDERDEGDEDEDKNIDDAEQSDIKFLHAIIKFFQHMVTSASEVINIAGVAVNSYTNTYYMLRLYSKGERSEVLRTGVASPATVKRHRWSAGKFYNVQKRTRWKYKERVLSTIKGSASKTSLRGIRKNRD
ncbi:hypothetical protein BDR07DRAFT_1481580 [Suillus spraguei]|nr:hypothetical protein BDR07DRAFT_1481580 [Suillus spraguei]